MMKVCKRLLLACSPSKFDHKDMEVAYCLAQNGIEAKLLTFLNLFVIVLTFIFSIVGLTLNIRLVIKLTLFCVLALSCIAFLTRRKWPVIQEIFILATILGSNYMCIISIVQPQNKDVLTHFMLGNVMGVIETIVILSFRKGYRQSIVMALLTGVKVIALKGLLFKAPGACLAIILNIVYIAIFYTYNNLLDRKNFQVMYESRDKLRKFQELLSNDFPSSVLIVDSTFDNILYSNQCFQAKFQVTDEKEHNIKICQKILLEAESSTDLTENKKDISLFNFLQSLPFDPLRPQDNIAVTTLSASYTDSLNNKTHYEIKLRQVFWDNHPAFAILLNDVSDKQMVVALRLADEQKDRVIATLSHELRTPINGILGLLEMVRARIIDTLSLTYLDYAKSCSNLLLYLVNSILDLSQLRHNSLRIVKTSFSLDELLGEVKSLYMFHSQQKGVEFVVEKGEDIPDMIYTDKYRLIEVLINLIGNAMKFTFEGSITLKISASEEDEHKTKFCITDTGIGIKDTDKPKLFQMFGKLSHSDKNINSQGVGLGLTIANELVKALNRKMSRAEKIGFESSYNQGSQFWFQIDTWLIEKEQIEDKDIDVSGETDNSEQIMENSPVSPKQLSIKLERYSQRKFSNIRDELRFCPNSQESEKLCADIQLLSSEHSTTKHALVVDDNPFNLMAASFVLEQLGYTTVKAFNGRECIALLEQTMDTDSRFTLIVTDIQMPVMDGLEMSSAITQLIQRGKMYPIPIIAATAQSLSRQEKMKYKEFGIRYTIEKPLNKEVMNKILDKLFMN